MASVAICWETDAAFKTAKKQGNAIPGRSLNPKLPFDLSSRLQLLLVFGSVSSQELDLGGSSEGDDGHDSQDEQGQLPAVDEGDDEADADVGKVLRQRRQTSTGSLERDINIQSASLILRGNNLKARLGIDSWTHPLNLSRVCGQSGRQRSNAVFRVVKPAEILWQQRRQIFTCRLIFFFFFFTKFALTIMEIRRDSRVLCFSCCLVLTSCFILCSPLLLPFSLCTPV